MENEAIPLGQQETILLVEDDEDVRIVTRQLLEQLNYRTLEVGDGPSALQALSELEQNNRDVDLVISDFVMPSGMNGIDLAIAVWGRYPNTPVMLTSGYPNATLMDAGMSKEDERHLSLLKKPYSKAQLATSVSEMLSR